MPTPESSPVEGVSLGTQPVEGESMQPHGQPKNGSTQPHADPSPPAEPETRALESEGPQSSWAKPSQASLPSHEDGPVASAIEPGATIEEEKGPWDGRPLSRWRGQPWKQGAHGQELAKALLAERRVMEALRLDEDAIATLQRISRGERVPRNAAAIVKALALRLEYSQAKPAVRISGADGEPLSIRIDLSAAEWRPPPPIEVRSDPQYPVPVRVMPPGPPPKEWLTPEEKREAEVRRTAIVPRGPVVHRRGHGPSSSVQLPPVQGVFVMPDDDGRGEGGGVSE